MVGGELGSKCVLVTGGAGYIGSVLTSLLLHAGHQVTVVDSLMHGVPSLLSVWSHPHFCFLRGDIRDPDLLAEALRGQDAVVHLAAVVGDPACAHQPELARQVNLDASLALLERAHSAGVRSFVFASTCSNYGRMADPTNYVDESGELRPLSLYAETKVAVERAILGHRPVDDFCPTILRFATIYGVSPRMRFDLTVNEFTRTMLVHKRLVVYGERFWRPYIHVRDAARLISLVLEAPARVVSGEVFNAGDTAENYRKVDLVSLLKARLPDGQVEYVRRDEDPRDYRVSFEKARQRLNFGITRTVGTGMDEIISAIRQGMIVNHDHTGYRN